MEWTRLGLVFVDIVLPLLTGYLLKTHNIISQKTCSRLILFNVVVLYTFINFISFWGLELSASLLWLPIASIFLTIIPGIISYLFFAGAFKDELDRGAYIISSMLSNIGTLSGLSAFILFGEPGFAYVQLVAAPQNCLMVAICFPLARYFVARHDAQLAGTRLHLSVREMFFTVNPDCPPGHARRCPASVSGRSPACSHRHGISLHGSYPCLVFPTSGRFPD